MCVFKIYDVQTEFIIEKQSSVQVKWMSVHPIMIGLGHQIKKRVNIRGLCKWRGQESTLLY